MKNIKLGQVGRAVSSDARDPPFESFFRKIVFAFSKLSCCIILIYNLSVAFWYDGLTLDQEVISPNLYDLNAVPRGKI